MRDEDRAVDGQVQVNGVGHGPKGLESPFREPGREFVTITTGQLLEAAKAPVEWIVDGLIVAGSVVLMGGQPKTAKTYFSLLIALCIARGRALLGTFTVRRPRPVLYVEEEDPKQLLGKRVQALLAALGLPMPENLYFAVWTGFRIDEQFWVDRIIKKIRELGVEVVVFDVLNKLHDQDENLASAMRPVIRAFDRIRRETGAAILILHHFRKENGSAASPGGQQLRGSSSLHGWMEAALYLVKRRNRVFVGVESKWTSVDPFGFVLDIKETAPGEPREAHFRLLDDAASLEADAMVARLLQAILKKYDDGGDDACTAKGLAPLASMSENSVTKYGRILADKGLVQIVEVRVKSGGMAASYVPKAPPPQGY